MTLCIATTSIPGSLPEKLAAISAAGFTDVELHEPDFTGYSGSAGDIAKLTEDLGLRLHLLQPFHDLEGQVDPDRALARLEAKFDLMDALGIDLLLVCSARQVDVTKSDDSIVDDLTRAALRAEARGKRLAYLALPWGARITDESAAADMVERVANPAFGLALNSYFSLAGGRRPADLRGLDGSKVFHVQLSDAPRMDTDLRHLKRHFGLLPGIGRLNLAGFVRMLARAGYAGPWSIARLGDLNGNGAASVASDGFRALLSLLDEVDSPEPGLALSPVALPPKVRAKGFEFIEFAVDDAAYDALTSLLSAMCFRLERRHISKSVELWRQGAINIVVNSDPSGYAHSAFVAHGPCVCDMGLKVGDAAQTVARAAALGSDPFSQPVGTGELDIPAIRGVGGSVVHFIDEKSDLHRVWDIEFEPVTKTAARQPAGLRRVDHLAQTMNGDEMQHWLLYYTSTFEMRKSDIVDVADPSGVVRSQAIETPEGEVRLNLNGAAGHRTFAGSFLADRFGAGVQHIAMATDDIFETSAALSAAGFPRLRVPDNYYSEIAIRYDLTVEDVDRLMANSILFERDGKAEYFQIYSQPIFNGFFFEIVQRRNGYAGYGASNAPIRLAAQRAFIRAEGVPAR